MDPVRYAWERCNLGVSFPAVLAKGLGPVPGTLSPGSPWRAPVFVQTIGETDVVRRALQSVSHELKGATFISREVGGDTPARS